MITSIAVVALAAGCSPTTAPSGADGHGTQAAIVIPDPYHVEITGSEHVWHVRHPDATGRLAAGISIPSTRTIHVPAGQTVVLHLRSADFLYLFAIPDLGLKELAVPNLEFQLQFHTSTAGQFELVGEQLCGDPDSAMTGSLIVAPRDRFLAWLQRRS